MQRSSIELKSSQYTLTLVMDPSVSFEQIVLDVMEKFHSSARFFKGAQMALEFRGRPLSTEQQARIADAIRQSCGLEIICILEKDEKMEEAQYKAITEVLKKHPQDPPRSPSSSPSPALTEGAETDRTESAHTADVIQGTIRNGRGQLQRQHLCGGLRSGNAPGGTGQGSPQLRGRSGPEAPDA